MINMSQFSSPGYSDEDHHPIHYVQFPGLQKNRVNQVLNLA